MTAKKSGVAGSAVETLLKIGGAAPSFNLSADEDESVSLKQYAGKKVVLYFYPKNDTSGCTQESSDFRDAYARFKKAGVVVLGVSRDSLDSHRKFRAKYSLPFPLLSDAEGKVTEAYGVWKEKSMYGRKYMGIERSTFLIQVAPSGRGKILKIYPKVKVTGHVDAVWRDLQSSETEG